MSAMSIGLTPSQPASSSQPHGRGGVTFRRGRGAGGTRGGTAGRGRGGANKNRFVTSRADGASDMISAEARAAAMQSPLDTGTVVSSRSF